MIYTLGYIEVQRGERSIALLGGEGPQFRSYLFFLGTKHGHVMLDVLWFHGVRRAFLLMFPRLRPPDKDWIRRI